MGRPRLNQDALAGIMFVLLGGFGLWLARDLQVGTIGSMQAGFFPVVLSVLLLVIGAGISISALFYRAPPPSAPAWRPLVFVTLSCMAFALLLRPLGLVATLATTIAVANLASGLLPVTRMLLLAAALIAINVGVFVIGLGIPFRLWPDVF